MVSLKFHSVSDFYGCLEIIKTKDENKLIIIVTNEDNISALHLDKSTAIKLSKELRKQIALLD